MPAPLPIFLNPHAGRGGDAERAALHQVFQNADADPEIHVIEPSQIESAIRAEAQRGTPLIGVAGGDGTISSAANALRDSNTTLLPIPLGTLNHFCNRYNIDRVDAAVRAWREQRTTRVSVGLVNNRVFLNNASCGFYPHLVRHRERLERLLPRMPAMWLAGMRVLAELPMMRIEIDIRGEQRGLRTPALWVGIGWNSLRLPEQDEPAGRAAGVLEIVAGRAQTRRHVVALALRLLSHLRRGLQPEAPNLVVEHAARFNLNARHIIDIALDGEPFRMRPPLRFAFQENGLSVLNLVGAPPTS